MVFIGIHVRFRLVSLAIVRLYNLSFPFLSL